MPTVSVIMPCFNHGLFLKESIHSVLSQSFDDLELIIIDDFSSDGSAGIIENLQRGDRRIKLIRHTRNQGVSAARNHGIEAVEGEFTAFCDADDIWEAGKLELQISLLRRRKDYALAYSDALIINEANCTTGIRFSKLFPVPTPSSGFLFASLARRNFINTQTVVVRSHCIKAFGGFDTSLDVLEDWWLWITLSRKYLFAYSDVPTGRYRVHSSSTNVTKKRIYSLCRFKVLRRLLQNCGYLSRTLRGELTYGLAVELHVLGRRRLARSLFARSAYLSMTGMQISATFPRALIRSLL